MLPFKLKANRKINDPSYCCDWVKHYRSNGCNSDQVLKCNRASLFKKIMRATEPSSIDAWQVEGNDWHCGPKEMPLKIAVTNADICTAEMEKKERKGETLQEKQYRKGSTKSVREWEELLGKLPWKCRAPPHWWQNVAGSDSQRSLPPPNCILLHPWNQGLDWVFLIIRPGSDFITRRPLVIKNGLVLT